ncbi:MAG: ankyrin repeat domain-containing protein [Pirellulales bacterium]
MKQTNTTEEIEFFRLLDSVDFDQIRAKVTHNPQLLSSYDNRNFGATPLTAACFSGRFDLAKLLIELGADPNFRSLWSMGPWSPLHCAIYRRDLQLAEFLLASGATLDVHTAAGLGRADQLQMLLDQDPARVGELGGDGCQPLHFAGSVEVAELLLNRGADINARCIDHYSTPVQYLCTSCPEVARFLLARCATADVFSVLICGELTLLEKMLSENGELSQARINQRFFPPGPEHNVHNVLTFTVGQDVTLLHTAARFDQADAIKLLVAHGISAEVRGGYDHSVPLHLAAWNNCAKAAAALLDCGAAIDIRSGPMHNNSPAGWAIVAGADTVFELLMDRGATQLPWFLDDARDALAGRFDQVSRASLEQRQRILKRLEPTQ